MSKEKVRARLEKEWKNLLQSFAGLPDKVLLEPNVVGTWSIRDVLAHISTWEEEAMKNIPLILHGQSVPPYTSVGGIDAFNARARDQNKNLALSEIEKEFQATHERLKTFLNNIPESAYTSNQRFLRRVRLDTYNHYREHAKHILAWREKNIK